MNNITLTTKKQMDMYSIGEFSKFTQLTPKALRLYHALGLLIPAEMNKYRYYSKEQIKTAALISELKNLCFSLVEIKNILKRIKQKKDTMNIFRKQRDKLSQEIKQHSAKLSKLERIMNTETPTEHISSYLQEEKVDSLLLTTIRDQEETVKQ